LSLVQYIFYHEVAFKNCSHPSELFIFITTVYQYHKDRCMTNQRLYKFRCLLYIKHEAHKLLTIFNVLPNLISPSVAACECATLLYTTWRRTQFCDIWRCPFYWC